MEKTKILVVEDEKGQRMRLENLLSDEGYEVKSVENGEQASQMLGETYYDVILADLRLHGKKNGIDILKEAKAIRQLTDRESAVIIITAYGSIENAVEAMKLGASDYITKPVSNDDLLIKIKEILATKELADKCIAESAIEKSTY